MFQGVSCHFEGGVGTRSLCAAGFVGDAAIDCEPSSNTIGIAHRGAAYLKITTRGRQAHTTYKHLGVNAIETMEPILAGLRALESTLPYEPHPLLPGGPILNIGTINGGTKHNQVPDRCTVTLDIRLLPSQDPHDVKRQVEEMIEALRTSVDPRIDAVVEFSEHWLSGPRLPYEIAAEAPIVLSLDKAVRVVTSNSPVYQGVPFWCDLVVLEQFGVSGVNFGPGDPPYNFPDEYVYEAQYLQAVDVYEQLIRELLSVSDLNVVHAASLARVGDSGQPRRGASQSDLDIVADGAVAIRDGVIAAVGTTAEVLATHADGDVPTIDATGTLCVAGASRVSQSSSVRRRSTP